MRSRASARPWTRRRGDDRPGRGRRHRHVAAGRRVARRRPLRALRQRLGRAILLGLELLVAADIIRTVAVTPTFTSAGVLGIIVVIRTFLSFSLEVELEGRWPWQKPK